MKKETLTKKVLKYAVGGVVGAVIGSGIGIGTTELEFLAYYFGGQVVTSKSDNGPYVPFGGPFGYLAVRVRGILYLIDRGIDRTQKGAIIGFPLGLAGYYGIRKIRERRQYDKNEKRNIN